MTTDSSAIIARIAAATASDDDWRTLIDRHGRGMSAAARLASPALADDAVQEALLLLPRCARRFHGGLDGDAAAGRWLNGIAMNCALALRRAESRRRRREREHTAARDAVDPPAGRENLAEAIAALGDADRRVLLLRHVEGLDHAGIGRALAIGEPAARKRLSRAHERLRRRLLACGVVLTLAQITDRLDAAVAADLTTCTDGQVTVNRAISANRSPRLRPRDAFTAPTTSARRAFAICVAIAIAVVVSWVGVTVALGVDYHVCESGWDANAAARINDGTMRLEDLFADHRRQAADSPAAPLMRFPTATIIIHHTDGGRVHPVALNYHSYGLSSIQLDAFHSRADDLTVAFAGRTDDGDAYVVTRGDSGDGTEPIRVVFRGARIVPYDRDSVRVEILP